MFTVRFIPDQRAFFMALGCERYDGFRLPYCYWFVRPDQACILLFGLWTYGWMKR